MNRDNQLIAPLSRDIWLIITSQLSSNDMIYVDAITALACLNKLINSYLALEIKRKQLLGVGIKQIIVSVDHKQIMVLNQQGQVFVSGDYPLGNVRPLVPYKDNPKVKMLSIDYKIKYIGKGLNYTCVVDDKGQVLVCGTNKLGSLGLKQGETQASLTKLKQFDNKPKQVANGTFHTLILDDTGCVWGFGENKNGQLGAGRDNKILNTATKLTNYPSNIKKIATKFEHTVILTADGQVFVCGNNRYGQLGTGDFDNLYNPTRLENFTNIVDIFVGMKQTFFINDNGDVYACGSNINSELGLGANSLPIVNTPTKINDINKIKYIFSSKDATFMIEEDKQVLCCGANLSNEPVSLLRDITDTPTKLDGIASIKIFLSSDKSTIFVNKYDQFLLRGKQKFGNLFSADTRTSKSSQPEPIPNTFTDKQKNQLIKECDIETLEALIKDDESYSCCCYQMLEEKLTSKNPEKLKDFYKQFKNTPWYQSRAKKLLDKLADIGKQYGNISDLPSRSNLFDLNKYLAKQLAQLKDQAVLEIKSYIQLIPDVIEGLLLVKLIESCGDEDKSPYGFIRKEAVFYGNTDSWGEIVGEIKKVLQILFTEAKQSGIELTQEQYQNYCKIISNYSPLSIKFSRKRHLNSN